MNEAAQEPTPRQGLPRWIEAPAAFLLLIATSPLLALAALAVRFSSPGPFVFRQQRVGRGGRPFTLYKLRTMRHGAPGAPVTAGDDPRITGVGRVLRRTKLDELPGLWNVVRADLSLVGPRPEVPACVDLGDPQWKEVLAARPGLTDPVTLRLRDEEALLRAVTGDRMAFYAQRLQPWKLRGYCAYLRRRTPWSDLAVLLQTVAGVLLPRRYPPLSPLEIAADE